VLAAVTTLITANSNPKAIWINFIQFGALGSVVARMLHS
jgi:lipoprotein signal peptidase